MAAANTDSRLSASVVAEEKRARNTRIALLAPGILTIVAIGIMPLSIVLLYSFLEPGDFGGVSWVPSFDAYVQLLFEEDIFDETLSFTTDYLEIFFRSVGLGLVYAYLPFMVLPIYASLEKLDFRLVEASYDLYATRFRVLRRIIIPLARPGIAAGCILVMIPSLGAYITPALLGGGKSLMIGNLIELQFGQARNWPFGSAIALVLMVLVMLSLMLYLRSGANRGETAND